MRIDRKKALAAFEEYTSHYDCSDEKIRLKVEHTHRVSALCERIARSLGLSEDEVSLAWLLGILHDVGRFDQIRIYGTFVDKDSVNHAQLSAEVLFEQGRIRDYAEDTSEDAVLRMAVASHSLYRLPAGLDARTIMFCRILRDADKVDILKVNIDFPYEEIYNVTTDELKSAQITPAVLAAFLEEHAVLHSLKQTVVDYIVGHISLMFELVYPESCKIVQEQQYLNKLLHFSSNNAETAKQFEIVREKMEQFLIGRGTEGNEQDTN